MQSHLMTIEVGFKHCDPAGIVFYPRYVEMISDTVEYWFKHRLGVEFDVLHRVRGLAIPIVDLHCSFKAPSRLGESLAAALTVDKIGQSALTLAVRLTSTGPEPTAKVSAKLTIVFVDIKSIQPINIPSDLRRSIEALEARPGLSAACLSSNEVVMSKIHQPKVSHVRGAVCPDSGASQGAHRAGEDALESASPPVPPALNSAQHSSHYLLNQVDKTLLSDG